MSTPATANTGDITGVTAGTGMSGGGTSGTVTLNCTIDTPAEVGLGNLSSSGNALSGSFTATGNITAYNSSDIALKENLNPISNALEKVMSISGYNFSWKDSNIKERGGEDGYFVRKKDVGIVAQEIEKILPEAVADREDGTKGVRYELLVPLLVNAIKELKEKVEELENGNSSK